MNNLANDFSHSLERAVLVCGELLSKSRDVEHSIAGLDALEKSLYSALTHAQTRRSILAHDFAALLQDTHRDYQAVEHKSLDSVNKISGVIHEGRTTLTAAVEKLHATH